MSWFLEPLLSKAPGYNPWKLYKVMLWFLKRLVTTLGSYVK
jgi:hypothetical protein